MPHWQYIQYSINTLKVFYKQSVQLKQIKTNKKIMSIKSLYERMIFCMFFFVLFSLYLSPKCPTRLVPKCPYTSAPAPPVIG